MSSNGAPTENISAFVNYHLHPLVTKIPSYTQDTSDFLRKVQGLPALPDNTLLVTLDVSSLYTNIPHAEGIAACREALDTKEHNQPPTSDLCKLIHSILTMNSFVFNGLYYLQIQGTAMGTWVAPSYANIFMGKLQKEILSAHHPPPLI